jgi:hypothetical protein
MRTALATILLLLTPFVVSQTLTTGGISGTIKDQNGAFVVGATVMIISRATGEKRIVVSDGMGSFTSSFHSPGEFEARVQATGFNLYAGDSIHVRLAETTVIDIVLTVAGIIADPVNVDGADGNIRKDNATLGGTIDARSIAALPLPTRSFTQLIALVPGASTYLNDPTAVGRNTQSVSVNGSRPTQNNFQINGVDANAGVMRDLQFGDPAPESITELKVQTSMYDATFGRAGGGSIQVVTKSGSNEMHGGIYEYFGNAVLNANDPFLKAAGQARPVLSRNVYGGTLGRAIQRDRVLFFVSFQGTRERNAASRGNSLRTGVFIDRALTNDRSDAALASAYPSVTIHPVSLRLLQKRLPDGRFVIPTPQVNGIANFAEISRFKEEQLNTNLDVRLNESNWLSVKLFHSRTPTKLAFGQSNLPGFGETRDRKNAIASVQDVHTFTPSFTNEARVGYNLIRDDARPATPIVDLDVGIHRATAEAHPGLTRLIIGNQFIFGAPQRYDRTAAPSASLSDTVSIRRGRHNLRLGGEVRYYQFDVTMNLFRHGSITFRSFNEFLAGIAENGRVTLGAGIRDRSLRTTDYAVFIQDDWKVSPKLNFNLGLRYELAPPFYDTRGRLATFDPALYVPRTVVTGLPIGPPVGGIVQAGNAIRELDDPGIPNVGKRLLHSIDPNNIGPRIGMAFSPFGTDRVVFRAGYGIFYSRASFQYAVLGSLSPPLYMLATNTEPRPLSDPFPSVPDVGQFPGIFPPQLLLGSSIDRNIRTPNIQQFNGTVQFGLSNSTVLEVAYVGTRGLSLFRQSAINQSFLASPIRPIRNIVTGTDETTNTPGNAQLRAPYQGVAVGATFSQNQTVAQSIYHSLQAGLSRRFSAGLQFLGSYTFSKSIDNASGIGGGSGVGGEIDPDFINDTSFPDGDQRDSRSGRGVSDFDRTHVLVFSSVWSLPRLPLGKGTKAGKSVFEGWQMSLIAQWMSGLPINIRDSRSAELFFGPNGGGDRPSWAPGSTAATATSNIPSGYYFNPQAFVRSIVATGQVIPSSHGEFLAGPGCPFVNSNGALCTDFGNVGRNPLRGPRQFNLDVAVSKRIALRESKSLDLRVEAFNLLNNVNFANPVSNFNTAANGGAIDNTTGRITALGGSFGKIISTSNNPRIVQLVAKFSF